MSPPGPPVMVMVESVVKLLAKSPSPARFSLAFIAPPGPPPVQSATTTKPPVAVRVASILGHVITPSVGSIGLPPMHLVPGSAAAPSWLDERDHCPAVGAGSCASVIGPAGPDAAAGVAATGVAAGAAAAAAVLVPAAALSAGFEHPASATAPRPAALIASPTQRPRIPTLPRLCFTCVTRVSDNLNPLAVTPVVAGVSPPCAIQPLSLYGGVSSGGECC